MERLMVYKAIDSERNYQDKETQNPDRKDMVEEFDMAQALLCIEEFSRIARTHWYKDYPANNYQTVTPLLRKICGVAVKMCEKYGVSQRERV